VGLLQTIPLQRPQSFSKTFNCCVGEDPASLTGCHEGAAEYAIEAHRTQDDHRRERLRFVRVFGVRSFVFEADARALRKRLPPKQTITIEKCTCLVSTRSAPGDLSGKQMSQFIDLSVGLGSLLWYGSY
jgi:hypothetical protein